MKRTKREEMEEEEGARRDTDRAPSFGRYLMDCCGAVGNYGTRSPSPHPILAAAVAFFPFALYPL